MANARELPPPAPLPRQEGTVDGPVRPHQPHCFGCGAENGAGLHLEFVRTGDVVRSEVTMSRFHEGAPGLAHGGVVSAVLDDMSGTIPVLLGLPAVTANLTVDFAAPVVVGRPLVAEAWLESHEGRKVRIVARLLDGDVVLATSRALFLSVPREHFRRGAAAAEAPGDHGDVAP